MNVHALVCTLLTYSKCQVAFHQGFAIASHLGYKTLTHLPPPSTSPSPTHDATRHMTNHMTSHMTTTCHLQQQHSLAQLTMTWSQSVMRKSDSPTEVMTPATESSARCMPEKSSTPFPVTRPWHQHSKVGRQSQSGSGSRGLGAGGGGQRTCFTDKPCCNSMLCIAAGAHHIVRMLQMEGGG